MFKATDGWKAAYTVVNEDGTRKRIVLRGRDEAHARERLEELKRRAKENPAKVIVKDSVEDYSMRWLERQKAQVKPSTYIHRRGHIVHHIVPAIGRTRLDRLTPAAVEDMTTSLMAEKNLSPRTVAHIRGTLRSVLKSAMRDGLVTTNAAALARPPRQSHKEMQTLTKAQVGRLLASTENGRYGPLWTLLVGSGIRVGEALALTWDDVTLDGDRGVLNVRRSYAKAGPGRWEVAEVKTKRSRRRIELPATVVGALLDLHDRQTVEMRDAGDLWQPYAHGQPLFTDQYGRIPEPTNINRALDKALEDAGLPHRRVHDLRHTHATLLLEQGVPLVTVSRLLGHSGIAITADVYSHVTSVMRHEAADIMDDVLNH